MGTAFRSIVRPKPGSGLSRMRFFFFSIAIELGIYFVAFPFPIVLPQPAVDAMDLIRVRSERARDVSVEQAIRGRFCFPGDQLKLRYYFNYVNLDGDSRPEVIAYVAGMCGSGGCETLILHRKGQEYRIISDIALTQTPIIVCETRSNGWKDLIVEVKGKLEIQRNGSIVIPNHYKRLQFNGREYPSNPTLLPMYTGKIRGTEFLADDLYYMGITLQCDKR